MILPFVTSFYDERRERERQRVLEAEDAKNFKKGQDVTLATERLILKAPDGGLWSVVVDNTGALSTESV